MENKFAHEESYRGKNLVDRLSEKLIVICGVGALGSNLADLLVRQGFSNLRVIDMDRVEDHNINTQLFGDRDVGDLKVAATMNRIFEDTGVEIDTNNKKLTEKTVKSMLKGADLVIDVFDNTESRRILHEYCKDNDISCIHGGMFEDYGEVAWNDNYSVPPDPPEDAVDVCDYPLTRNLVMFVITILAEEVVNFCLEKKPRFKSWAITLKDMKIGSYR